MTLLSVRGLTVRHGNAVVVDGVDFDVAPGEALGIVGESGSGKTQTALALLGLTPGSADVSGSIRLDGQELVGATEPVLDAVRATRIAMVFQDPLQALNPYLRIGAQLGHVLEAHGLSTGRETGERVVAMLDAVGLPDPARQVLAWPHELSGGMRQRVMIAAALIAEPAILVADEPTTALDVTVQAQILALLDRLRRDTALLLITHDLGVVAGQCERVLVMDRGRVAETGATRDVFGAPSANATRALLDAVPRLDAPGPAARDAPGLLAAEGLSVRYRARRGKALAAVKSADLELKEGETLAIVGESGSGKSTLARAILGLVSPAAGTVVYAGQALARDLVDRAGTTRRDLQLVFQDPAASLDPQMRVSSIVGEPRAIAGNPATAGEITAALADVGLDTTFLDRYAHQLSGGQAQRVAIARALIARPTVLVCDEAVAALDGTVRTTVLALLREIQARTGLAILFIAHDLAVVRQIAHRVAVMYLGEIVELAPGNELFERPRHPYTRALLDAVPPPPGEAGRPAVLPGEVPSPLSPPPGCVFHPRCRYAEDGCRAEAPARRAAGNSSVACRRAEELDLARGRA